MSFILRPALRRSLPVTAAATRTRLFATRIPTSSTGRPATQDNWVQSDSYHNSFLIHPDPAIESALQNSDKSGLRQVSVSRAQGKFLNLLARSVGAKRVLEVGTLGGFSAINWARALPEGGQLVTLELTSEVAKVAQQNIDNAGVSSKVKILVGPAAETLPALASEEPFDIAFVDADKESNLVYFLEAKKLVKSGGIIIVDNVVQDGTVSDLSIQNEKVEGTRKLLKYIQGDKSVDATTISTVGEKGYDGFLYAVKL